MKNSVTRLDRVCRNYKDLRELKLDNNDLIEIEDDAFEDCRDMVILTFRHNKLTELSRDTVSFWSWLRSLIFVSSSTACQKFKSWFLTTTIWQVYPMMCSSHSVISSTFIFVRMSEYRQTSIALILF